MISLIKLSLLMAIAAVSVAEYKRVCYYTNWAQWRAEPAKFYPEDVDPFLCTHVIFAFAGMNGNRLAPHEFNDDGPGNMYERVNNLKKKNPKLKTLLAVGGWNFGVAKMSAMLSTASNRQEFVSSSIDFLRARDFDGLDLDFEYPANRGSPAGDKQLFTSLCKELREGFEAEARTSGRPRLLVTAAVAAGKSTVDKAYERGKIAQYLDFINLMTYDLHNGYEATTGHNAPLFSRAAESSADKLLNVAFAAAYWAEECPRNKLIIGMPTYGRGFTLADPSNTGYGSRGTGPCPAGRFTGERGFYAYFEVCELLAGGATRYWNGEHQVPHVVKGSQWIGYDDKESLLNKVRWLKKEGYGGWMVWPLDEDDFSGQFCGEGAYPLLNAMKKEVEGSPSGGDSGIPTPSTPTTTTKTTTTTQSSGSGGSFDAASFCQSKPDGFYQNGPDCSSYLRCVSKKPNVVSCGAGLAWDDTIKSCNWQNQVNC